MWCLGGLLFNLWRYYILIDGYTGLVFTTKYKQKIKTVYIVGILCRGVIFLLYGERDFPQLALQGARCLK